MEKSIAVKIFERLGNSPTVIDEGSEPAEFWDALGGEGDYDKELEPLGAPFLDPRLFHCRILKNGRFRVEEIAQFEQDDLCVDDVMVLDGGDEIYVWEGDKCDEEEKTKSVDMAKVCVTHLNGDWMHRL